MELVLVPWNLLMELELVRLSCLTMVQVENYKVFLVSVPLIRHHFHYLSQTRLIH